MTLAIRSTTVGLFVAGALVLCVFLGCGSQTGSSSGDLGKVTKENVLKVTEGMSIDDAKLILGPPTKHTELLHIMEWGSAGTPGPWITLDYDKDTLKITRKKIIGMD